MNTNSLYFIPIKRWGTYIDNVITLEHVRIFYLLSLDPTSAFYKFIKTSDNHFEKISGSFIQKYFEFNVDEFVNEASQIIDAPTPNYPINQQLPVTVATGGNYSSSDKTTFLVRMLKYLYGDDIIKFQNGGSQTYIQRIKPNANTDVGSDVSVLIYLIGFKDTLFYAKFMYSNSANNNLSPEIKIYDELKVLVTQNNPEAKIAEKMVMVAAGTGKISSVEKLLQFKHVSEYTAQTYVVNIDYKISNELSMIGSKLEYVITPYDPNYTILSEFIKNDSELNALNYQLMIQGIVSLLNYLKEKIGFHHMDLHHENILVNKKTLKPKIFDFDLSETEKTLQSKKYITEFETRIKDHDPVKIKEVFGFTGPKLHECLMIYDLYRMFHYFYKDNRYLTFNGVVSEIKNLLFSKISTYIDNDIPNDEFSQLVAYNGKYYAIPIMEIRKVKEICNSYEFSKLLNAIKSVNLIQYDKMHKKTHSLLLYMIDDFLELDEKSKAKLSTSSVTSLNPLSMSMSTKSQIIPRQKLSDNDILTRADFYTKSMLMGKSKNPTDLSQAGIFNFNLTDNMEQPIQNQENDINILLNKKESEEQDKRAKILKLAVEYENEKLIYQRKK